jgi:hypothetical protein
MNRIGEQVILPLGTALRITLQGIRIRLGRALVTLFGVMLGIAFLMSTLTTALIQRGLAEQEATRHTVTLMRNMVKNEIGSTAGKTLAVAVMGELSMAEQRLMDALLKAEPAGVRAYNVAMRDPRLVSSPLAGLAEGASILLILGDGTRFPVPLADAARNMVQPVVLDTLETRSFPLPVPESIHRRLFFGRQEQIVTEQLREQAATDRVRRYWIVGISLLVTMAGIANALLMSITERFKEIGTMKCLGAMSRFIRQLFLIESWIIGSIGSVLGILLGAALPLIAYGLAYGLPAVFGTLDTGRFALYGLLCLVAGTALSILAAIYPASFAARMLPASALRSNV